MIKVTKRIGDFEITIETDEPFSKEALDTLLYEVHSDHKYKDSTAKHRWRAIDQTIAVAQDVQKDPDDYTHAEILFYHGNKEDKIKRLRIEHPRVSTSFNPLEVTIGSKLDETVND